MTNSQSLTNRNNDSQFTIMADLNAELSRSQTDLLLQFQDLTGIEEMERCLLILQDHNWDIETAVQDTLNIREGAPSVYRPPSFNNVPVITSPADQRIYHFSSRRPLGLMEWGYYMLTFPFNFVYSTVFSLLRFIFALFRPDPRRALTDPVGDVVTFISKYEDHYGPTHPVFYQGTYSQALSDAKRELKFLLVYLHGDDHQDTPGFCRKTMGNSSVVDFVNTNMLFWACSVNSPEGYRVSQALRENSYPFLAVIVLRDNRMTVVARLEGPRPPESLVTTLGKIIQDNEASLVVARQERRELSQNQTLRQQQDEAYLESLRADQEKERKRQEERERKELEEQQLKDKEVAEQRRREDIRRQKVELSDQIPSEPAPDDPYIIQVVIKLPSGKRLERRFRKDHSLKHLFYYVFCDEDSPDNFQIFANYPRRVLPCQPTFDCPEPPTFAQAGLGRSEVVFVQDLEA